MPAALSSENAHPQCPGRHAIRHHPSPQAAPSTAPKPDHRFPWGRAKGAQGDSLTGFSLSKLRTAKMRPNAHSQVPGQLRVPGHAGS